LAVLAPLLFGQNSILPFLTPVRPSRLKATNLCCELHRWTPHRNPSPRFCSQFPSPQSIQLPRPEVLHNGEIVPFRFFVLLFFFRCWRDPNLKEASDALSVRSRYRRLCPVLHRQDRCQGMPLFPFPVGWSFFSSHDSAGIEVPRRVGPPLP